MKYLIDECVNLKKRYRKNKSIVLSEYKLGMGTKDHIVLEYAVKNNLKLVTNDMKLAMQTALRNHPVFFLDKRQKGFTLKLEETDEVTKFNDSTTFYLLENDQVVIP